ncbi:unnamed protein product [Orchesella dallaii]|uniref:Small RNA 2'-O-methyltransferase n=1 Tax=Orchesella dallaii TaxID=48710 RepID=A0ABP1RFY2_9HEXA
MDMGLLKVKGESISDEKMEMEEGCGTANSCLELPQGAQNTSTVQGAEVEDSETVKFEPPVYIQRYYRVNQVIENMLESPKYKKLHQTSGKTIMEVGCAEFGMMKYFKRNLDVGKLIFLDLDADLLREKTHLLKPLPAEYLQRISRPEALQVQAYAGCITTVDAEVRKENPDIWAVVGIEIIEHLHADVLRGFEETVFGIIAPNLVIVTTPNAEFNEVFNLPPGKFRHWDHKFEWTRQEFRQWCEKIVGEFQFYTYKIEGICEGSEATRHLGCVSQMAIFEKLMDQKPNAPLFLHRVQKDAYALIESLEYPNFKETRTTEEITLCESNYYISYFVLSPSMRNEYDDSGMTQLKLPLQRLQNLPSMPKTASEDATFLRSVLEKGGFQIAEEDGQMSVIINLDDTSSGHDSDSDMNDEEILCADVVDLNVNRVDTINIDEENWE